MYLPRVVFPLSDRQDRWSPWHWTLWTVKWFQWQGQGEFLRQMLIEWLKISCMYSEKTWKIIQTNLFILTMTQLIEQGFASIQYYNSISNNILPSVFAIRDYRALELKNYKFINQGLHIFILDRGWFQSFQTGDSQPLPHNPTYVSWPEACIQCIHAAYKARVT